MALRMVIEEAAEELENGALGDPPSCLVGRAITGSTL
jgi:hypothetical protein